jgi:hypothetical protein
MPVRFYTFLKTGVEVLDLGMQHSEGNAWPIEYWRTNKGRWRLYTPAIDRFLNHELSQLDFGPQIQDFVFFLEIADFESWGGPPAFHTPEPHISYSPTTKSVTSVGQIDWLLIQNATLSEQYRAYSETLLIAVKRAIAYRRFPKAFAKQEFQNFIGNALAKGKPSAFTRARMR